ncbi:MAG: hypothetical protein ACLSXM_05445, partial [Turicibacter sanguinis]
MDTIKIGDEEFIITDDVVRYNKIRLYYQDLSIQCREYFKEEYRKNYKNLEQLCKPSDTDGAMLGCKIIKVALDKTIELLVDLGYIDIDVQLFYSNYYSDYCTWEEDFEEIRECYLKFVYNQEMMDAYRAERKLNRGKIVGGGFGVKGAAKGMLLAGAGNLLLGATYGITNSLDKFISECRDYSKMGQIFNDPNTLNYLAFCLEIAVFNIHIGYVKFLLENSNGDIFVVTETNSRRATNIFNNLKDRFSSKSGYLSLMKTVIELNPYENEIYLTYIDRFGDEDNELEYLAEYFGIKIGIIKEFIISSYYQSKLADCKDEKSCLNLLEELKDK